MYIMQFKTPEDYNNHIEAKIKRECASGGCKLAIKGWNVYAMLYAFDLGRN